MCEIRFPSYFFGSANGTCISFNGWRHRYHISRTEDYKLQYNEKVYQQITLDYTFLAFLYAQHNYTVHTRLITGLLACLLFEWGIVIPLLQTLLTMRARKLLQNTYK